MSEEYSYYKIDGETRKTVEAIEHAKKFVDFARKALAARFDASYFIPKYEREHLSMSAESFMFEGGTIPEGWDVVRDQKDGTILALPPEDSPEAEVVRQSLKEINQYMPYFWTEAALGAPEMPMKEKPAGKYDGSFVKEKTVISEDFNSSARAEGHKRDNVTFMFGSNSPCKGSDPIDFVQFGDDYYLRVPNDENGQPRFVPEHAERVSLDEMRAIDKRDHEISRGLTPS